MEKLTDKSLTDKAIDLRGKRYVLVSDRVLYFNEKYPEGSITTELISVPEAKHIIIKARVSPDQGPRIFTGYSQAIIGEGMVNRTAALENAETSAVGRALAFMGIGVIESIASADELTKATDAPQTAQKAPTATKQADPHAATKARIAELMHDLGKPITKLTAKKLVEEMSGLPLVEANYPQIVERLRDLIESESPFNS